MAIDVLEEAPEYIIHESEQKYPGMPAPAEPSAPEEKPAETSEETPETTEENAEPATAEETEETDGEDSADASPKKPKGVQKRIDELTRQRYDAERAAENARREADYYRSLANQGTKPTEVQAPTGKEPKLEDFDSYDAFIEAKAAHVFEKKQHALREQQALQRQQEETDSLRKSFAEKAELGRKKYADYDEIVHSPNVHIAQHTAALVMQSDLAHELAYHIAKNPDIAAKINALNPVLAAKEIGRLEANLAVKPQAKKISSAPPPIKPIKGKEEVKKDLHSLSTAEYIARRNEEERKKRRR